MERHDFGLQRRRLCRQLRRLRTDSGLTQKAVGKKLFWHETKILRIESGQSGIAITDLHALLRLYKVAEDSALFERLTAIAHATHTVQAAKARQWARYSDILAAEFIDFLEFEDSAAIIRHFEPNLVPGPLQTESYARIIISALSAPNTSNLIIERKIEARVRRASLLQEEVRPERLFVIDEAVIRRIVGASSEAGAQIMYEQLQHLAVVAEMPHVSVQVIPFQAGEHRGMTGPFVVLDFEDIDDDPLLYLENANGDMVTREDSDQTTSYIDIFLRLEELALPLNESISLIREAARSIRRGRNDESPSVG
jgi:transcriptional regulator with XRE-family HTH domain